MQPMPGYKIGYALRRRCVKRILGNRCGKKVVVKDHCYFGNGNRLTVGDNSQMGQNAKLLGTVTIGKDVLMGPDVVIMATSHIGSGAVVTHSFPDNSIIGDVPTKLLKTR